MGLPKRWAFVLVILKETVRKFFTDNGLFLSAALAFNLLLYFIPLSLLMISLLGYTVLDSERAMSEVQSVLQAFLPRSQQAFVENLTGVIADRGLLGFAGFASFFIFSTLLFGSVRTALNHVFQVKQKRTFAKGLRIDLLLIGLTAALLLLAVGATSFLTVAHAVAEQFPSWSALLYPGLLVFGKLLGATSTAILVFVLYRWSAAATLPTRALILGSVTTVVLLQLTKWGFAWYVEFAQEQVALYGVLGGFMFLFLWLYYASVVFVVGAEVGWVFAQTREGMASRRIGSDGITGPGKGC